MGLRDDFATLLEGMNELRRRIVFGGIFALGVLVITLIGEPLFTAFILLVSMLMILEWMALTRELSRELQLLGFVYVLLPALSLHMLRSLVYPQGNQLETMYGFISPWPVIYLITVVVVTDTAAYFVGKRFGKHKMAPQISPKKSWEGLAAGMGAAIVTSMLFSTQMIFPGSLGSAVLMGIVLAGAAQLGDLAESLIKRKAGVKDSGALLPGHGGILDRTDGLVLSAPVYLLLAWANGGAVL